MVSSPSRFRDDDRRTECCPGQQMAWPAHMLQIRGSRRDLALPKRNLLGTLTVTFVEMTLSLQERSLQRRKSMRGVGFPDFLVGRHGAVVPLASPRVHAHTPSGRSHASP